MWPLRFGVPGVPTMENTADSSTQTLHDQGVYPKSQVVGSCLTQNPLHLFTPLDFADKAPLERADTGVELKAGEHLKSGVCGECLFNNGAINQLFYGNMHLLLTEYLIHIKCFFL